MKTSKVDALVIGAGVGGLCTAARLVEKGVKVALVEKLPFVGGRFSTRTVKGFKITTGAMMVPFGKKSAFQEAFDLIGAHLNVREMKAGFRYRLSHGDYEVPPEGGGMIGMLQFAMGDVTAAQELFLHFRKALGQWEPADTISFKEWLSQYTGHPNVHNLFQGFCGAFVGVNAYEVPAGEFFRFLKNMGRGNRYGIAVNGNIDLMEALASAIKEKGARVSTRTGCKEILVEGGRVRGAVIEHEGVEEVVDADVVISNAGPSMTVRLAGEAHFEKSYLALLREHAFVTPVIHICIGSREPLYPFPGILNFGNTRRLVFMECPTLTCPELAPEGMHLTTTFSVPRYSTGPLKLKETIEMALLDLQENFPSFNKDADPLLVATHHGEWPSMRRWPGYPMPIRTPVENLYNVGDGCMPPGMVGVEACAVTARKAAQEIVSRK